MEFWFGPARMCTVPDTQLSESGHPWTMADPARILIVDDDPDVLTAARLLLKQHFAHVQTVRSPSLLPTTLEASTFDVVLLDMNFVLGASSGAEGLNALERLVKQDAAAVVVITAHGDIPLAVEAMKRGAADFVVKPWENDPLVATLKRVAAARRGKQQPDKPAPPTLGEVIGHSDAMRRVMAMVRRAAPTDASVLILGENGTGKEVMAREIHRLSARSQQVFLAVDLGSLSAHVFESELFGHRRGAFTDAKEDRVGRFQAASGGTLFLDEIGNVPLPLQSKLLTAIERREVTPVGATKPVPVDVRLVTATNMPLQELMNAANFRADLFHRINTVEISLPPLRERTEDIPLLVAHFVELYARKYNMAPKRVSPDAMQRLLSHPWPGNVRALRQAVERATILGEGVALEPADFPLTAPTGLAASEQQPLNLDAMEKQAVERALKKHQGNVSQAAAELGLTRASLYRRMERHGL